MKKTPHVVAVGLIAFSCLTFPQETKSEPITAIVIGALWSYGLPASVAALGSCAVWLKAREYLVNKKLEEVDRKVEEGFAEAAAGRTQINSRLDQHSDQLAQVQSGLSSLATQVRKQHGSVLVAIEESREEAKISLTEAQRRQQESHASFKREVSSLLEVGHNAVALSIDEIKELAREAEKRSQDRFTDFSSQFELFQSKFEKNQKNFGLEQDKNLEEVKQGIQDINARVKGQNRMSEKLRTDIKNLQEGAAQVVQGQDQIRKGQAEILQLLRAAGSTKTNGSVRAIVRRHFVDLSPAFFVMNIKQIESSSSLQQFNRGLGFTPEKHATLFGHDNFSRLAITVGT